MNDIYNASRTIGDALAEKHGIDYPDGADLGAIPTDKVDAIAEDILTVIAEILQSWINAGSERDVTMENDALLAALTEEVRGWTGP